MSSAVGPCRAVALLLIAAACGGKRVDHPGEAATKFLPATLEATSPRAGDPRIVKVRILADAVVRAAPRWREDITDQIDYAGQLLQPLLGIRLVVDAIKDWDLAAGATATLNDLATADSAEGVTWVIGYLGSGDRAGTVMSELGEAQPLGQHVIVRSWADSPETFALEGRIPGPGHPARAEVIGAHRRHKQTVVLLHMLATTLGAIAEADPAWIQHVSYSPSQHTFADRTRDLLQLAIDRRLAGATDLAIARVLAEAIEKAEWGGWVASSRNEVLAVLHNVIEAGRAGQTAADVPTAALDQWKRVSALAKHGQAAVALAELDNLLTAYPGNAAMHQLKCDIMLRTPGVSDPTTRAACARVAALAPGDPGVHLAVSEALIRANDLAGARGELVLAEGKIDNLRTGGPEAWRRLIGIYKGLGALTWTEDAIAKAKLTGDPIGAAIAQTRARFGIPRGATFVTPDREAALVSAIRGALDLIYANKFGDAERALATAEQQWRGAPGLTAARCDLALRTGQFAAAQAACARAVAAAPDASWAIYLQGVLLLRDAATTTAGIERLKRAIEIDPELGQAWRTLGKAYARGGEQAAFDQLAKAYAARFGQALAR
jgi:predicted Zn-dependent protease